MMPRSESSQTLRQPTGRRHVLWVLFSMGLLVLVPPAAQLLSDLAAGRRPVLVDLLVAPSDRQRLRAIEDRLQETAVVDSWLRPRWAVLGDRWFERGNDQVVFGRGEELFLRDGLRYLWTPSFDQPRATRVADLEPTVEGSDPLAVILDFHQQLQRHNIELMLLPVPAKATVQPDRMSRGSAADARPQNPGFEEFLGHLTTAGVAVFDPTERLLQARREQTRVFLEGDTHWSPEGMRLVAEALAERVRQLPLWAELGSASAPYDERHVTVEGTGDLVGLLDSAGYLQRDSMVVDVQQVIARRDGRPPIDRGSPILLLGDSFSQIYSNPELGFGIRGGLGETLAGALGLPVDLIAIPGGGANRARQALALRPEGVTGKQLVIWQMSQRDLLFGREGWARVELPQAQSAPPAEASGEGAAQQSRYKVLAFLEQVSELPPVLDYADCLISAEYWMIDGYLPVETRRVFYVFHPGWQDFEPSEWSRLAPSSVWELEVEPLAEHVDLEDSCWIDTVGVRGSPWWVISATERER